VRLITHIDRIHHISIELPAHIECGEMSSVVKMIKVHGIP
jgi:hypothetical protein